ncbi:hypothetical protein [Candidatus Phytoplasma australasiaticum]|uniref:hypothetical protein n=1 Tax=Candidatus Phytoplasma australasiaticum TaxID=2754999 RepID=UPI003D77426C
MDNGGSKNMTQNVESFISLIALQGRGISFENRKKEYILSIGRIAKSLHNSIENIYYVNRVKFNLLSVS